MKKNTLVQPFLKWAGGKRQLLSELKKRVPSNYTTYYEPFLGAGSLLLYLQPKIAVVNDVNTDLINLYEIIKNDVESLIKDLSKHKNNSDYFYKIREIDRNQQEYDKLSIVEKASRLMYLNKTCYNGLFRVNRSGEFNVPFGRYKNPNIINEITLRAVNNYFNKSNIIFKNTDFFSALDSITKDSFVYFDPPYDPVSSSANFTGYVKNGFDKSEQYRLKDLCENLDKRGIKFLLSNSSTNFIKNLYKDYEIEVVKAKRIISSKVSARSVTDELLIRNYR